MKPIESTFEYKGVKHSLVKREGDVALFSTSVNNQLEGYEVVRIRKYEDRVIPQNQMLVPAHEAFPPDSAWGDEAWIYSGNSPKLTPSECLKLHEKAALQRFESEVAKNPDGKNLGGGPTGKPRGRVRKAFELDVTVFGANNFLFADIEKAYPDMDGPTLRNRLNDLIKDGKVKVVGKITGGVGKPKNLHQVV